VDRNYHVRILAKRLLRIDKDMNAGARTQFAAWIPEGDMGRFANPSSPPPAPAASPPIGGRRIRQATPRKMMNCRVAGKGRRWKNSFRRVESLTARSAQI